MYLKIASYWEAMHFHFKALNVSTEVTFSLLKNIKANFTCFWHQNKQVPTNVKWNTFYLFAKRDYVDFLLLIWNFKTSLMERGYFRKQKNHSQNSKWFSYFCQKKTPKKTCFCPNRIYITVGEQKFIRWKGWLIWIFSVVLEKH